MTALDEPQRLAVLAVIERLGREPGPLLEILHAVQDALGWIPPAAVPVVAGALKLSRAEVHGVVSFYQHFRSTPPGAHVVRVCVAESCRALGAEMLESHARARLAVEPGQTTPDGRVTLESVSCLGLCACSPAVMIDGEPHGRMTPERFDELGEALEPLK